MCQFTSGTGFPFYAWRGGSNTDVEGVIKGLKSEIGVETACIAPGIVEKTSVHVVEPDV
jgi:hypothetical protein